MRQHLAIHFVFPLALLLNLNHELGGFQVDGTQLMHEPGFENTSPGVLPSGTAKKGWEIQRTGRKGIQEKLQAECVRDKRLAKSGNQVLRMKIPKNTEGFEFVTIGQRHRLRSGKVYRASVWVRWPDGPAESPSNASSVSGHPSAIVSFWVRHKNATGGFAGRDVWLFDNSWQRLTFDFHSTDPTQPSLIYVSLLPNQTPQSTTILVDDFELMAKPTVAAKTDHTKELVSDRSFEKIRLSGSAKGSLPWKFEQKGSSKINGKVVKIDGKRVFQMRMNQLTNNYQSAQLSQDLELANGITYHVSCRMKWDNFQQSGPLPIVNYGFYHEASNTWYGPVDQYLKQTEKWETYSFKHIPPYSGKWRLYVQLNGWGNFGNEVLVSFGDLSCKPDPDALKLGQDRND